MQHNLEVRVVKLEKSIRWLTTLLVVESLLFVPLSCTAARSIPNTRSLRVHEIVVVDDHGVERARLGGNLPDAVIRGKRIPRGDDAAGLLLYDKSGQERGGYVTFRRGNEIALTLDTTERQAALFVAPAEGGSALRLWNGDDEVALRADEDGARLTAVENGVVAYQEPPIVAPEKTSACAELRAARGRMDAAQVMRYCRKVMPEEACRACLAWGQ